MFSKIASFGAVGALALGGMAVLATPAQAAPAAVKKKCAIGSWRLSGQATTNVAVVGGKKIVTKMSGGTGTKLKITTSTASYDFSKSKPVWMVANTPNGVLKAKFTYRKTLKYAVKLTGGAKGTFTPKAKTATGPATVRAVILPDIDGGVQRLAPQVRSGDDVFVVRVKALSLCTKKTLTLSQKHGEPDGSTTTRKVIYRRTK
ncbi:hypothetical protein [Actinocorallia longicatena]|uniref:Uncharacterized protein n=1 Tax=Actinocorallia longicatena TaxID=111803 RepID=A0ABP6Q7R8_9ACTN